MPQNKYLTQNYNHNFQFQSIDDEITMFIVNKLAPQTMDLMKSLLNC